MTGKTKILVLASGTKSGGGSGFEKHLEFSQNTGSDYEIAAVASNHENGGVRERADRLGVRFIHFPAPWNAEAYRSVLAASGAAFVVCSGWLKLVVGLNPATTINTHPALLSFKKRRFGGHGMYGMRVHEAVADALNKGELDPGPRSGLTMHFVTNVDDDPEKSYDKGPSFCETPMALKKGMTAAEIEALVSKAEHMWCPMMTDMIVRGLIRLENGRVVTSIGYQLPKQ